jgi:Caspase domain
MHHTVYRLAIGGSRMTRLRLLATSAFAVAILTSVSNADVHSLDWKTTGDGLLTFDDVNRREWLDLSVSPFGPFSAVQTQIAAGGDFAGFQIPKLDDVKGFATSAGMNPATLTFSFEAATHLEQLVSVTAFDGLSHYSTGWVQDAVGLDGHHATANIYAVMAQSGGHGIPPQPAGGFLGVINYLVGDPSRTWLYRQPTTYAILVGSDAPSFVGDPSVFDVPHAIRGDTDANNVAARLHGVGWHTSVNVLPYDFVTHPDTVKSDIDSAISNVASQVAISGDSSPTSAKDTLLFFYSGHGLLSNGHALAAPVGTIGPTGTLDSVGAYTDNDLLTALENPKLADVRKIVLLDSCHAGGFLTDELKGLHDIALLAAATADGFAVTAGDGTGVFTDAILPYLNANTTFADLESFAATKYSPTVTGFFKDAGSGVGSNQLFAYISPDFDVSLGLDGLPVFVPEPATLVLLLMSSVMLWCYGKPAPSRFTMRIERSTSRPAA